MEPEPREPLKNDSLIQLSFNTLQDIEPVRHQRTQLSTPEKKKKRMEMAAKIRQHNRQI